MMNQTHDPLRGIEAAGILKGEAPAESPMWELENAIGDTEGDQQRNALLLKGYDYSKYPESLTGYTGQDQQWISFQRRERAVRVRVGPKGNYKAGLIQLPDGELILASCRDNNEQDPAKRRFAIHVYESTDEGFTWQEIGRTPLFGKESSLTALPDGMLVLTAEKGYYGPGANPHEIFLARSQDGGRTWETAMLPGGDKPHNMIVEPDGSLLMVRAARCGWLYPNEGSPKLQICRSSDGGRTWESMESIVDWDCTVFGEVSSIRFPDGRLLAALRRQIPGTTGEGFEDTVITESADGGKTWTSPRKMTNTAEVHVYLTSLGGENVLATYSNYHLPWGVYAILSEDGGRTWDLKHPIQLSLSADIYVGWPVTLLLPDGSLITSYATTTYAKERPKFTTCEVVRWRLPR